MWNLLKSVFRSLKQNKVATIGLTFLVFLSTATFTVLNSTTTNINNKYNQIKNEGHLHDFTISELYNNAEPEYTFNLDKKNSPIGKKQWGESVDGKIVPWPYDFTSTEGTPCRTWWYVLDIKNLDDTTPLKLFFEKNKEDPNYSDVLFPLITIENPTELGYVKKSSNYVSSENESDIYKEISKLKENNIIEKAINDTKSEILNKLNSGPTPMMDFLAVTDEVEGYKKINSLNISNSQDKIYYKVIESNPNDEMDKIVLFNETFNNIGRNNFLYTDWNPMYGVENLNQEAIEGMIPGEIASIKTPKYEEVTEKKEQDRIIAKFKLLNKGTCSDQRSGESSFKDIVKNISSLKWDSPDFKTSYENWIQYFSDKEFVSFSDYKITIVYNQTPPIIWTMENWTSYFSVFSPSHMQQANKKPFDIREIGKIEMFQKWLENHPDIQKDEKWKQITLFLNNCTQDELAGYETTANQRIPGFLDIFRETFNENTIMIDDSIPIIILGAGITPDYIYPIVSLERPIPNTKEECVLFSNSSGYERLHTAYRGNQTENYIVGKFKNNIDKEKVILEINEKGKNILSWPPNIRCAYLAGDTTNILNASSFRVAYIPSFVEKVNTIDYFLTMFIVVLGILISLIVIRRYIMNNKINIGIMQANGIGKSSIAISLSPFSLIPALIGGVSGYAVGSILQLFALGLFGTYWVIPTPILGFSWVALVSSILIPLILFICASYISTYILLKQKTVNLMKYGSEFKTNIISRFATKTFSSLNALTKFRISIAFNSVWRLLILCVMVSLTVSTFVFGVAVDNKFDQALAATNKSRNYKYSIDLFTPTVQGGQYIPNDSETFGNSGLKETGNSKEEIYTPSVFLQDSSWPASEKIRKRYYDISFMAKESDKELFYDSVKDHGNVLMPMLADSMSSNWDLQYLKNRVSTKTVMDFEVGIIGSASANPWKIAKSLMPDNSINLSDQKTKKLINEMGEKAYTKGSSLEDYQDLFIRPSTGETDYKINTEKAIESNPPDNVMNTYFKVSDENGDKIINNFNSLLWKMYESEKMENGLNGINNDYSINYNTVPISQEDETYTYISADGIEKNNKENFFTDSGIKIMGIKAFKNGASNLSTEYINLMDKNKKDLIPKITYDINKNNNYFPIVVNEYAAKKHKIKVNDQLKFEVKNHVNRFQDKIDKMTKKPTVSFTVVGISQSFTGEEYFTNQDAANYILGLKTNYDALGKKSISNKYIDFSNFDDPAKSRDDLDLIDLSNFNGDNKTPLGFNGVFTKNTNGGRLLANSISLYSPTGIWPATDKTTSPSMLATLQTSINTWLASKLCGFENTDLGRKIQTAYEVWQNDQTPENIEEIQKYSENVMAEINNYFGKMSYVSLLENVMSSSANEIVLNSMSRTINSVEQIIIIVISLMVGLIVMLITSIIISDSKKMAGLLKALGYTDRENTITFLSTYLPVIGFGLLLAIPLSLGVVSIFQSAIFTGAKILLSTTIQWWFFPAGILLVVGLLSITAGLGYNSIKKEKLVDLIK